MSTVDDGTCTDDDLWQAVGQLCAFEQAVEQLCAFEQAVRAQRLALITEIDRRRARPGAPSCSTAHLWLRRRHVAWPATVACSSW